MELRPALTCRVRSPSGVREPGVGDAASGNNGSIDYPSLLGLVAPPMEIAVRVEKMKA